MAFDYSRARPQAARRRRSEPAVRQGRGLVADRKRGMILRLEAGDVLFEPGQSKAGLVYRIRKGQLAVEPVLGESVKGGAPGRVFEVDDFVGLGFLENHAARGEAVTPLELVVWGRGDFDRLARRSPELLEVLDDLLRLEFVWWRAQCVAEGLVARGEG